MNEYVVDGDGVSCFDDFVEQCNAAFIRPFGGHWTGNLDAFNDYLSWPEPVLYRLTIRNSAACRDAPGHATEAQRLRGPPRTCHTDSESLVQSHLREARTRRGPTFFDTLLEISEDNRAFVRVSLE